MIAKWVVVGRIRAIEHPLWSSFVWRNEVSDTLRRDGCCAVVRARRHRHLGDEPVAARRSAPIDRARRVVRDVLATRRPTWSPSARARPSTAAAWCRPTCSTTASCGWTPLCWKRFDAGHRTASALPAARIGAGAPVGPASLVMRGDEVPPSTRWQGNPIAPWNLFRKKRGDATRRPAPKNQKTPPRDAKQESGRGRRPRHRSIHPGQRQLRLPGVRATNSTSNTRWRSTGCPGRPPITAVTLRRVCAASPWTCRTPFR